jgi:hypothetical protein
MPAMPMQAAIQAHVVPHEDDLLHSKLDREIERVEAGVATPADGPEFRYEEPVLALLDLNPFDAPRALLALLILADLEAREVRDPRIFVPPNEVAAVEDIRPGGEQP